MSNHNWIETRAGVKTTEGRDSCGELAQHNKAGVAGYSMNHEENRTEGS